MVKSPWVAAAFVVIATLAPPVRADVPSPSDPSVPLGLSRGISIQPMLSEGEHLDPARLARMVDAAASWARRTSSGAWKLTPSGIRPTNRMGDERCSTLAGGVARDRQAPHPDGTVTVYIGNARDCPYVGLAETPGAWVLLPRLNPREDISVRTLAHELGHTLGLLHAGADTCSLLTASPRERARPCAVSEYGDFTDPMGRGSLAWSLGPIARSALGWASLTAVAGDGRHDIRLGPEEAIRVVDPVDGTTYVVAHRSPGPGAPRRSLGVHLYRLPQAHEYEVSSVHLPWMDSGSWPWGGRAGMAFRSPSGAVSIDVRSTSATGTAVTVGIDATGGIADRWGPVFAGGTPEIRGRGGTARLHVPRAFDQSGVTRYVVRVDNRVIASRPARPGIDSWSLPLPRDVSRARTISVLAIDAAGNATTITLGAGARPAGR